MNVNPDLTVMDYWPDREISRNQGFWRQSVLGVTTTC